MSDPTPVPSEELVLRFTSSDWNDVEFVVSKEDHELNIELMIDGYNNNYTWLTFEEAKRLRDWLNKVYP